VLLGTSVINAMILYKQVTGKQIRISEFREEIIINEEKFMIRLFLQDLINIGWLKTINVKKIVIEKKEVDVLVVMKD
jgi:hypothetical protein